MTTTDTETIADIIVHAVKKAMEPRDQKIAALSTRLAELETRGPGCEYKGVYKQGTTYERGSLVTRDGGLWLTLNDTTMTPGSCAHWKLVVKSGRA